MIAYTIADIKKILLEIEEAESVLENFVYGEVACLTMANELATIESDEWSEELTENVSLKAASLGMKIEKVDLVNLSEIRTIRLMMPAIGQAMEEE